MKVDLLDLSNKPLEIIEFVSKTCRALEFEKCKNYAEILEFRIDPEYDMIVTKCIAEKMGGKVISENVIEISEVDFTMFMMKLLTSTVPKK